MAQFHSYNALSKILEMSTYQGSQSLMEVDMYRDPVSHFFCTVQDLVVTMIYQTFVIILCDNLKVFIRILHSMYQSSCTFQDPAVI